MTEQNNIESILDELESRYEASVGRLRKALALYAREGIRPDPATRDDGAFAYPELRVEYDPESPPPTPDRAFARLNQPGIYTASIARPALFRAYLHEQLEHLIRDYPVKVSVGTSASEIPYPYVLDGGDLDLQGISTAELSRWFPSTDLIHIGDEVADGAWDVVLDPTRPLALFDALRTDFSLARLKHYTGTPAEHFQRFVLFTNYVRYVDEFVRFAIAALRDPASRFTTLSVPGGTFEHGDLADAEEQIAAGVWRR
ncbi:MAG: AMP nucleosidase, partial [Sphingomicrobium sp.]